MNLAATCCICGSPKCEETYDHHRITPRELSALFRQNRQQRPGLLELQQRVEQHYRNLTEQLLKALHNDRRQVQQQLKQLEFPQLNNGKFRMELIGRLASGDFSLLPTRRIIPLVEKLQEGLPAAPPSNIDNQIQRIVKEHTSADRLQLTIAEASKTLLLLPVIEASASQKILLKRTISTRDPVEAAEHPLSDDYTFTLQNVPYRMSSRELELNNKKLTDADLFEPIQRMKHFPHLTKLELRFNRITEITCRHISVHLERLQRLDIRGNKLKDSSVIVIARSLKNLKELFVCDNDLSDESMAEIATSMKLLSLIWMENNKITCKGAKLIIDTPSVKAIGLQGNSISNEQAIYLKKRYSFGYLSI